MIRALSPPEPEAFRNARAEAWLFALSCLQENRREDCLADKNAAGVTSTNGDDGTKIKGDSAYGRIIP
jgi:hypothetical protein